MTDIEILESLKAYTSKPEVIDRAIAALQQQEEYVTKMDEVRRAYDNISRAEPCEDEYIKVPKKALKYRTTGMVAYNAEWLKNHFDIERSVICGEQDPCDDCISRKHIQEKYRTCADMLHEDAAIVMEWVNDAPSVYPKQKVGYWIDVGSGQECSECGEIQYGYDSFRHFCANCGSRMEVYDATDN